MPRVFQGHILSGKRARDAACRVYTCTVRRAPSVSFDPSRHSHEGIVINKLKVSYAIHRDHTMVERCRSPCAHTETPRTEVLGGCHRT